MGLIGWKLQRVKKQTKQKRDARASPKKTDVRTQFPALMLFYSTLVNVNLNTHTCVCVCVCVCVRQRDLERKRETSGREGDRVLKKENNGVGECRNEYLHVCLNDWIPTYWLMVDIKQERERQRDREERVRMWYIYIYIYISISIIHLRCIREVFSDALSSLPISGYFCIISARTVTPAWL